MEDAEIEYYGALIRSRVQTSALDASSDCGRDHCTPEERAVIDSAIEYHEMRLMQGGTRRTLSELLKKVDDPLAARNKTNL